MSKSTQKNKKFSLNISLNDIQKDHSLFVINLKNKKTPSPEASLSNSTLKSSAKNYWRVKRVAGSLPFFFRPLTRHHHSGIFLNKRAEEVRDRFSQFERKLFKKTIIGKISSFLLALFIIFIPLKLLAYYKLFDPFALKERVSGSSHLALRDLSSAASAASEFDLKLASNDFADAANHFLQAEGDLKNIDQSLLNLVALSGRKDLRLAAEGKNFLQAGAKASSLGKHLSLALDGLFSKGDPEKSLQIFIQEGNQALQDSNDLVKIIQKINPESLPEEYRQQYLGVEKKINILNEALSEFIPMASQIGDLFGVHRDRRYLLIFQNNTEMRGAGGFMGSYALVDFSGGKVKNLEIPGGGTYDMKGGLKAFVKSPQALHLIAPRWYFWDANWFPDWALSAENIRWFYEKSGGPTVNGVIAFTPDIIAGLLAITGPIDLTNEYGVIVDQNNFYEVTQQITEKDNLVKDGELSKDDFTGLKLSSDSINSPIEIKQDLERNVGKKPKKIIGDLTAKILKELPKKIDRANALKLVDLLEKSLAQKQLMFNFSDPRLQKEVEKYNWAGRQFEGDGDYLMVVNSNISGGKSDYRITERIEQSTEIQADGKILNTVRITRKHNGVKGEKLFGMTNVNWLRVYVPLGSRLISSSGFVSPDPALFKKSSEDWDERLVISQGEGMALADDQGTMTYNENKKTVFANWLMVEPGDEKTAEFSYYLPFSVSPNRDSLPIWQKNLERFVFGEKDKLAKYYLIVQKQPGGKSSEYYHQTNLASQRFSSLWVYPEQKDTSSPSLNQSATLDRDQNFGLIFKSNY